MWILASSAMVPGKVGFGGCRPADMISDTCESWCSYIHSGLSSKSAGMGMLVW